MICDLRFWDRPGWAIENRVVYTVKFREAVCVLHVFHNKSKSGFATPKPDMDIIHERLKIAEKLAREMRDE